MDGAGFQRASNFAMAHESDWPRDLPADWPRRMADDHGGVIGPVTARGGPSGLVWHEGAVVHRWGDPSRVDMAFSVAKSCLALVAGVA